MTDDRDDVENPNRVPKRQWRKWNKRSRELFNDLFSYMSKNQKIFTHPRTIQAPLEYWQTTAWNAAWMAADLNRSIDKEEKEALRGQEK